MYRNIEGTELIMHGEWADPEIIYDNKIINANEFEDFAWESYIDDCKTEGKEPSAIEYDNLSTEWFKKELDEFMYAKFGE